jgi:hypothetical protein
MSEGLLPEGVEPEAKPPKKHGRARFLDPLLSSVPTLIGVLVGAVTSHFAEVQRVDFEREDRFRHEQVERVAQVAHGYDLLTEPLTGMIAAVQTRQPGLCRFMKLASAAELKLRDAGVLHGRLFSPGTVDPNATAEYGREIDAQLDAADPGIKAGAGFLKSMIALYTTMLADVANADAQFAQKREAFQGTLMFEVKVYFPERVRKDVYGTVNAFADIARRTTAVQAPNRLCTVDSAGLSTELVALNVRATREMTAFAQSLEPELGDKSIQN